VHAQLHAYPCAYDATHAFFLIANDLGNEITWHHVVQSLPGLLQATYFYRLPDLVDAVKDSSTNMCRLTSALQSLAIADSAEEAKALLRKGSRAPTDHVGMQYVSAALLLWC
jgi:hypothetical protein